MSGREYTARTVEEALERALNDMMLTRDDVEYEVVVQPSKGFFGFGQKDAVIRVRKKVIEELKNIVADIQEERKVSEMQEQVAKKEENPSEEKAKNGSVEMAEKKQEKYPAQEETISQTSEKEEAVMEEKSSENDSCEKTEEKKAEISEKAANKKEAFEAAEQKGRAFLSKIFEEMDLEIAIEVKEKNNYLIFDLKGERLGILIGRRGDTLDALQFLMNLVINEKNATKVKGIIDIENYREKREETLIGLSHKLAAKARKTGQKVVLEPMNPQERRIIHMALQNDKRVSTYSEGEEPYRKVVIVPEVFSKEYSKREKKQG